MGTVELAAMVRDARGEQSYADVAQAARLSHTYVWKLEHGRIREPSPNALRSLAGALGVPYTSMMRAAGYL